LYLTGRLMSSERRAMDHRPKRISLAYIG